MASGLSLSLGILSICYVLFRHEHVEPTGGQMSSNRPNCRVRRWSAGAGLAAAAAAVIGVGTAHADTPDDVLGQAVTVINEGDALLATAPTADLGTKSAELLSRQENLGGLDSDLNQLASLQDQLTPTGQTFLASADEQFVSAAQNVLSADQAFVAADQAGELSGSGGNLTDLTVLYADLGLISADFNVTGDELLALFTGGLDTTSAANLASSLAPESASAVAAADPSDLLSEASSTLTSANQGLDSVDVSGLNEQLAQTISTQLSFDNHALVDIGNLASAESLISANDGGFSTLVNEVLTPIDQNIYQSTEAILAADQAFDAAVSADPGGLDPTTLLADIGLVAPDYQLLGEVINALPIDWIGNLF
jgi:hypothetical protein